jgi:hypothetical protein
MLRENNQLEININYIKGKNLFPLRGPWRYTPQISFGGSDKVMRGP